MRNIKYWAAIVLGAICLSALWFLSVIAFLIIGLVVAVYKALPCLLAIALAGYVYISYIQAG